MKIAFVLYDRFTALDLVGPYEVIARWPGAEVHFVATGPDPVRADAGLVVLPTSTLDSLTAPDLVLVPGSGDPMPVLNDKALLAWVRHVSQHATWMASVCTGASIYAAAGILAGRRAATHWAFRDVLASMGVNVCPGRVVFDEPFVSSAGVSAGIDLALALTARVDGPAMAEAIQLVIEYDPQPPFDAGAPHKASDQVMRAAGKILAAAASP
jgi:transcriptional regulator GlxA family with amidase domain